MTKNPFAEREPHQTGNAFLISDLNDCGNHCFNIDLKAEITLDLELDNWEEERNFVGAVSFKRRNALEFDINKSSKED